MRSGRGSPEEPPLPTLHLRFYDSVTVTLQVSVKVKPLYVVVAVMLHVPGSTAVTVPLFTVATFPSELDHVTVPPEGHVVAVRASV